jgi:BirA family transcriptional regulator, biotin operon repressor / biotin---[acetyl-CoA-carboxylase] ligase
LRSNPFEDAIARVRDRLDPLGSTIVYHPTIGSTNDMAADLAARSAEAFALRESLTTSADARRERAFAERNAQPSAEGLVVVADEQTAGRGRRGHTWFSPPGSGLYVSVVLRPGRARIDPVRATTLLTLAAGVAIAEGVEIASGLRVDLKWPNDLFVGRRKLGGILAEAHDVPTGPHPTKVVVLGYGINVGRMAYPPEIADRATSLESELGRAVDRHLLFAETLAALAARYGDLLDGSFDAILDAWRGRAPSAIGARVIWTTAAGQQTGVAQGIDDQGALLVRTDANLERIVSGELTWVWQ